MAISWMSWRLLEEPRRIGGIASHSALDRRIQGRNAHPVALKSMPTAPSAPNVRGGWARSIAKGPWRGIKSISRTGAPTLARVLALVMMPLLMVARTNRSRTYRGSWQRQRSSWQEEMVLLLMMALLLACLLWVMMRPRRLLSSCRRLRRHWRGLQDGELTPSHPCGQEGAAHKEEGGAHL